MVEANNQDNDYMRKDNDESFTIFCRNIHDHIPVLHELGHAFLDLDSIQVGERMGAEGTSEAEIRADMFARSFAMPRRLFELNVIENTSGGLCDIRSMARDYKTNYLNVIARGEDIYLWA